MNATSTLDFSQLDTAAAALEPTLRYTVMLSALCSVSNNIGIYSLLKYCEKKLDEKAFVAFVELSRRALIKTVPVIGAARAHIGLVVILRAVSEDVKAQLSKERYRTEEERDYNFAMKRGSDFASKLNGDALNARYQETIAACPELEEVLGFDTYGRCLSSENLMPIKESQLCMIATVKTLGADEYLKSHYNGAVVYGASRDECEAALAIGDLALGV